MTADNASSEGAHDATIFSARLTPHRSLPSTGFLVLMVVFGGVSFIAGIVFWILGAWPVFGFFGLDVIVIYIAFRINYRRAQGAHEDIHVTHSEVNIRRVTHRGHQVEYTFNPLWVRLDEIGDPDYGVERLAIVSRGRIVPVARCLGPAEKAEFAVALRAALAAARRGPTYNPV